MHTMKRHLTAVKPMRAVAVTLGLSAAGAGLGFAAGSLAFGVVFLLGDGWVFFTDAIGGVGFAGIVGANLGAVCTPLIAWLLLRYVPLGRAFLGLTLGTMAGGLAGWYLLIENTWFGPVYGALAGFVMAGVALRLLARPARRPLVRLYRG
jgi:hypothetical protein